MPALEIEISSESSNHWTPDKAACHKWLLQALHAAHFDTPCQVSLRFADREESAALNLKFRSKQGASNVLSFPSALPDALPEAPGYQLLGDIVICPEIVVGEAQEQGKPAEAHWAHLLIHGILHLIGHDHQQSAAAAAMESLEIQSLEKLGYPNPYLSGCSAETSNLNKGS
ncbi:MAG: rRNA maturation RNase YbeY [Pseudohongiellaceae bacterium]